MTTLRRSFLLGAIASGLALTEGCARSAGDPPFAQEVPKEILENQALVASYRALGYDLPAVYGVFADVRSAFKQDDIKLFADACLFPVMIFVNRERIVARDSDEIESMRKYVFSESVKRAVAAQEFEHLFLTAQGIMFGQGQLWITTRCADRRCVKVDYGVGVVNVV